MKALLRSKRNTIYCTPRVAFEDHKVSLETFFHLTIGRSVAHSSARLIKVSRLTKDEKRNGKQDTSSLFKYNAQESTRAKCLRPLTYLEQVSLI